MLALWLGDGVSAPPPPPPVPMRPTRLSDRGGVLVPERKLPLALELGLSGLKLLPASGSGVLRRARLAPETVLLS